MLSVNILSELKELNSVYIYERSDAGFRANQRWPESI